MRVRLEGQPVEILAMLLERPNQLVSREELQKKLWSSDTFVDFEQSLNAAIRRLRLALDDSAESPRYIETLARKGYRWVAPVEGARPAGTVVAQPAEVTTKQPRGRTATRIAVGAAVGLAILVIAWGALRSRPVRDRLMLAVLPFQNLSGEEQQEYLADGMTEEMITQLGGLNPQRLGVIARTSAMQYKGSHKGTSQIARELNVNYLLEGSVRRQEQRIRVTARLIQTSDQAEIWADSYDADISDILKVQGEVARAIAGQIRMQLPQQAERRLSGTHRVNALAHDSYLQGQQAWNLRDKEGTARSIQQFRHAIEIDPNYAAAYAGLARAYALSPVSGLMSASEAMPKARETASRAIALDDSLAEAHSLMGFIEAHYDYDWPAARQEYQKALQLNPSDSIAHLFYSNSYLSPLGRHDEAIAEMKTAIALDPFSARIQSFLGRTYIWARRYDDALAHLKHTTEMFPSFAIDHQRLAHLYAYREEYDKAISEETRARILAGEDPHAVLKLEDSLRQAIATRGPRGYWEKLLELSRQADNPPEAYTTTDGLAILYVRLGDKEKALRALEQGYRERQLHMTEIGIEPTFDALRPEPQFQDLLRRVGVQR
ncbi:MAG TPA: winged helix-turn-helix domain-containing protein [Candidatus Acidoferrum sp.]|nr:winged helix-turn-helix domain-containing protein [Candidatus Acidoferrum sp.]